MKAEDNKFPYLTLTERESAPAIPDSGTARVFVGTDGRPQFIDDAGVVTEVGADGEPGADGVGVPPGGTTGQMLAKATADDFDTAWVDKPTGGGGGGPVNATDVAVTPTGNIASTDVQAALAELDAEKVAATGTITKLRNLTQAQYDALAPAPAADTLYVIVG